MKTHGARRPTLLEPLVEEAMYANPTRHVRYGLAAPDEDQALRLAQDEFFQTGLNAGVNALPADARDFGWFASTDVRRA